MLIINHQKLIRCILNRRWQSGINDKASTIDGKPFLMDTREKITKLPTRVIRYEINNAIRCNRMSR